MFENRLAETLAKESFVADEHVSRAQFARLEISQTKRSAWAKARMKKVVGRLSFVVSEKPILPASFVFCR